MSLEIKGLKELEKNLKNMEKKLDKYNKSESVSLPYTEDQWDLMSEYEKNNAIEKAKNEYINKIKKDLFR